MIDYYFIHEFQWKNGWFSNSGISKPIIRSDVNFAFESYVDYSILESVILHTKLLNKYSTGLELLTQLEERLRNNELCGISNEIASIEMNSDFSKPIDNLGSIDGIDSPISWNIITDDKYQKIPTSKVLSLIKDWLEFIRIIEEKPPTI